MNNLGPLIINLDSTDISSNESDLLTNDFIGGVLLFEHNYLNKIQIKTLIADIKKINKNLLIFVDHEGGRVQRFKEEFTQLPSFTSIGDIYQENKDFAKEVAYSCGYVGGYELRSVGVDINFSPVIDLSSKSGVLSERTLSDSPQIVSILASEYIRGIIDNGIVPVLKHYPGHGSVNNDTHIEVSESELSLDSLKDHLSVFKIIKSNFDVPIMTSHIKFKNIDSEPVTTSVKWLKDISKNNFSNNVFYISDDLEMSGISKYYNNLSKIEIMTHALKNGCSMIIVTTMQNQSLINTRSSHKFYREEYLNSLKNLDVFRENMINLPCFGNITYNKGNNESYQLALKNLSKHRDIL